MINHDLETRDLNAWRVEIPRLEARTVAGKSCFVFIVQVNACLTDSSQFSLSIYLSIYLSIFLSIYLSIFFLKYLFLMDLLSLYKYQLGYWQICDELDRCRVVEEKVGTEAPVSSGTNHLITTNFSLILPCGFSFCSVDSFMGLRENLPRFFFLH